MSRACAVGLTTFQRTTPSLPMMNVPRTDRPRSSSGAGLDHMIDVDLSVSGLAPPLHLPVMAGLAQGPGFPNLSCLGLLSDRILRRYVAVNDAGTLVPERSELA